MLEIPAGLQQLKNTFAGRAWLSRLPALVDACVERWSLRLGRPYEGSQVSIVFPVEVADRPPAVLKVQFPHKESEHEAEALRLWNGSGAARLFDYDPELHALLMEKCEPGDHLSAAPAEEALAVFAELLPRLWIEAHEPFVSLSAESAAWAEQLPSGWERAGRPFEVQLLDAALEAVSTLRVSQGPQVLVHQDLHGDNVLRAQRESWLVIDPKPLIGEREFSLAPIVRAYEFGHSRQCAIGRLDRLSSGLRLNRERARLWAFVQTLAWSIEGQTALTRHVETARWLWEG